MKFKYEIYDHDIGGTVHNDDGFTSISEVAEVVKTDLDYDFEGDIEFDPDGDKVKADLEKFDVTKIVKSLLAFNFADGFCLWTCVLPGGHRELHVSQISK